MNSRKTLTILLTSALLLVVGAFVSLTIGATADYDPQIFWLLRVPRTLSAMAVGGGLAVAGAMIQSTMANPLAEPYTIGIASAAALGATLGKVLPFHPLLGSGALAFAFAIAGTLILVAWARRSFRQTTEVLLAGVVIGFFCTSAATLLTAVMDPATWASTMSWILGSLGGLSSHEAAAALALMLVAVLIGWIHSKPLDLMSIDDLTAESAGLDVGAFRKRLIVLVALMTALSVSIAGVIGFVGLIVPHSLRKLGVSSHRVLIPACFLSGAGLLLCSDTLSRVIVRPSEIPVGVVMTFVGAPFFLAIIRSRRSAS